MEFTPLFLIAIVIIVVVAPLSTRTFGPRKYGGCDSGSCAVRPSCSSGVCSV